ncbi:unnamed protein product [Closterium sp. Yama58-4]|nr:unnamed protein product [Closterium sp. Yama58-4]
MVFPVTWSWSRSLVAWAAFVVLIGTVECAGSHATRLLLTEPLAGGVAPMNLTAPGLQTTSVHAVNPAANAAVDPEASVAAEAAAEMFGFRLRDEEECSPSLAGSRERVANESSWIDAAVSEGGLADDANGSTGSSGSSDGSGGGGGGSSEAEVARCVSERMMALIAEGRGQLEGERLEEAVATYDEAERLLRRLHQRLFHGRGVAKSLLRLHEPAVADFEQAVSANPNNAELWMEVGAERETLGHHERACEAFSRALELLPGDVEALKRRDSLKDLLPPFPPSLPPPNFPLPLSPPLLPSPLSLFPPCAGLSAVNLYRFKDALKDLLLVLHMLPNDADLSRAVVTPLFCYPQLLLPAALPIASPLHPCLFPLLPSPHTPLLPPPHSPTLPPVSPLFPPFAPFPFPHQGIAFVRSNQFRPAQPYLARATYPDVSTPPLPAPCPPPQGIACIRSNQFQPAQPYLARAVELLPGDADLCKEKGRLHRLLRLLGETDQAEVYKNINATSVHVLHFLPSLYFHSLILAYSLHVPGRILETHHNLVLQKRLLGDHWGVTPMAHAGLKAFPGDLEIMHAKASSLHVLGEHAAAMRLYDKMLSSPGHPNKQTSYRHRTFFQRHLLAYTVARLDQPFSAFCIDDDLDEEWWSKGATGGRPEDVPGFVLLAIPEDQLQAATWQHLPRLSRTAVQLVEAADVIGARTHYDTDGMLHNTQQVSMEEWHDVMA